MDNIFLICSSIWTFLSPIASGVVTALIWAFIILVFTYYRNFKLVRQIKKSMSNINTSFGIDEISIILRNDVHVQLIVREVAMLIVATKGHPELRSGAKTGLLILNYFGPGGMVVSDEVSDKDERDFVTLPPYTQGEWGTKPELFKHNWGIFGSSKCAGCKITVEYMTLLRKPKLLEVELTDENSQCVSYAFNEKLGMNETEEGLAKGEKNIKDNIEPQEL